MFLIDPPDYQISRFFLSHCRNLQQIWVTPKQLRINKINAVLYAVGLAFDVIKLKNKHGIEIIP